MHSVFKLASFFKTYFGLRKKVSLKPPPFLGFNPLGLTYPGVIIWKIRRDDRRKPIMFEAEVKERVKGKGGIGSPRSKSRRK
jgi:hypothetical protein